MVYGIEHSSLGSEAIPDKGCHGLLRIADVWTGRGPPAGTGQAAVILKDVRIWCRLVLNIRPDRHANPVGHQNAITDQNQAVGPVAGWTSHRLPVRCSGLVKMVLSLVDRR